MVVEFTLTCPRCGTDVRKIAADNPKGYSQRERRLVVQCTKKFCEHTAVVVCELVDLTAQRGAA